ncbi:MAG: DUF3365 domain-containing protein [Bacteroidales bacterium]|nr:DUF3365 domain-containing protein [Bacteroidales bacterium]
MKTKYLSIVLLILFISVSCGYIGSKRVKPNDETTWIWTGPFTDDIAAKYKSIGREVLKESFLTLTGEVSRAMKEGGVPHAVQYCNMKAYPIIDSLSKANHVSIKRVAMKNRNPDNFMRAFEQELYKDYAMKHIQKMSIMDQVVLSKDNYLEYYAPIIVTAQCLACHGKPGTDIQPENYELIKSLYPDDKAIDHYVGDLRGMWRIRFMPTKQ